MKNITLVIGTRPNMIKALPIYHKLRNLQQYDVKLIHTGQHYDHNMSGVFLESFGSIKPDKILEINGAPVNEQMSLMFNFLNNSFLELSPDLILVFGDVTSTLVATIVANKLDIRIAHIEAGLRSFDKTMPEETNRIITDHLCDYHFVTEESGLINLKHEGIETKNIYYVGNTMIDTLYEFKDYCRNLSSYKKYSLELHNYILFTFHRQSNVDNYCVLSKIVKYLNALEHKTILPLHPRTTLRLKEFNLIINNRNIIITDPLGYFDFIGLVINSGLVVTDSGGIQEETSYLGIPCITIRPNTERPVTISHGTNILADIDDDLIKKTNERFASDPIIISILTRIVQ
jgi:UDP-N-acetylglucosamine 2-epimerase (non-hydrolysing)